MHKKLLLKEAEDEPNLHWSSHLACHPRLSILGQQCHFATHIMIKRKNYASSYCIVLLYDISWYRMVLYCPVLYCIFYHQFHRHHHHHHRHVHHHHVYHDQVCVLAMFSLPSLSHSYKTWVLLFVITLWWSSMQSRRSESDNNDDVIEGDDDQDDRNDHHDHDDCDEQDDQDDVLKVLPLLLPSLLPVTSIMLTGSESR